MEKDQVAAIGFSPDSMVLRPIEALLQELAASPALPEVALGTCALRFEESHPPLLALLARAAHGEPLSDDEERLLFRGLFLLGGGRNRQACAPLLKLLRLPPDRVDVLLGDAVTDSLPRIVVGIFDGHADALLGVATDPSVDEFVRASLLDAAAFLTWEGRIDAGQMHAFLKRFHAERLAPEGDFAWFGWQNAIALLGLRDLAPLFGQAWDAGLMLEEWMEREDFEQDLARAERDPGDPKRFEDANIGYIEDILVALSPYCEEADVSDDPCVDFDDLTPIGLGPVRNPVRNVGRNDPCPCGSGKKFKKCCLVA